MKYAVGDRVRVTYVGSVVAADGEWVTLSHGLSGSTYHDVESPQNFTTILEKAKPKVGDKVTSSGQAQLPDGTILGKHPGSGYFVKCGGRWHSTNDGRSYGPFLGSSRAIIFIPE